MKGNKSFLQWVIRSSRPKRKQLMLDPRLVTSMHCKRKKKKIIKKLEKKRKETLEIKKGGNNKERKEVFQQYTTPFASQLIRQQVGGFSFDVGLQRMRCIKTTRQKPLVRRSVHPRILQNGNSLQKYGHKCQIINFILNSKR